MLVAVRGRSGCCSRLPVLLSTTVSRLSTTSGSSNNNNSNSSGNSSNSTTQQVQGLDIQAAAKAPQWLVKPAVDDPLYRAGTATESSLKFDPRAFQIYKRARHWRRALAGAVDLGVAAVLGAAIGVAPYMVDVIAAELAVELAASSTVAAWLLRDAATREGNRSFGKKLMKLEIIKWDGELPTRSAMIIRNLHWALYPAALVHPVAMDFALLAAGADIAGFFTPESRKVGDLLVGTYVIDEAADRAARVEKAADFEEMRKLEKMLRKNMPASSA